MTGPRLDLATPRLTLVAVTLETIEAEIGDRVRLVRLLGADVPADWPPPLNDEHTMRWTRDHLVANVDPRAGEEPLRSRAGARARSDHVRAHAETLTIPLTYARTPPTF